MASFEDIFRGYGGDTDMLGAGPAAAGGGYGMGGLGAMRNQMMGMGLGMMAPGGQGGWGGALRGWTAGAGMDQSAAQNATANRLKLMQMAQQESQFSRSLAARQDKPQIYFKTTGYDDEGNPTYDAFSVQNGPNGPIARKIPMEQAQALRAAGVPAEGGPAGGAPGYDLQTPQPFTGE